ncbi:MAG: anhydro-N-acetylmuramic acid kinase [Planctomycetes bacterium]|nr:anhydro-N-acetylmuramic acid kinase [Planctomycetota bacterium]
MDLALVRVSGAGLAREVEVVAGGMRPFPDEIRAAVARALDWKVADLAAWHARLGVAFADAAATFLSEAGVKPGEVLAVGSHGQTVFHHGGDPLDGSLQIGEPAWMAERLGIPVIADFRTADRALGGQGAPVSPFADWILHHRAGDRLAILNLGGIANLTLLQGVQAPRAWDSGPANGPLDALMRASVAGDFDEDGALALQGKVLPELLAELQRDSYFARSLPKSTGLERFGRAFAGQVRAADSQAVLADQLRTCCALAAWAVADSLSQVLSEDADVLNLPLYLCGGGAHNLALVAELRAALPHAELHSYQDLGGDPDLREAVAFALLADAFLAGEPASWPGTTGCQRPARLGSCFLPPSSSTNFTPQAI